METDSHNQRHKSYGGTCRTVTTATGCAGGGGVVMEGVEVGRGIIVRLSEIGCWWFGAMVQPSWRLCPRRDTESALPLLNLHRSECSGFMIEISGTVAALAAESLR